MLPSCGAISRAAPLRAALGDGLDDLWAAGANLDLAAAVELALVSLD